MQTFIGLSALVLFYFVVGRVVATHTLFGRYFASSILFNVLSAFAIWFLAALVALFLGVALDVMWWVYVAVCAAGLVFSWAFRRDALPSEHSFTLPFVSCLFLIPVFFFVWADVPVQMHELLVDYPLFESLNAGAVGAVAPVNGNLTVGLFLYPLSTFLSGYDAVFALFNVLLLAMVADAMIKVTNLQVRWSNLPLLAVGALMGLCVLNPFMNLESLASFNSDLLFAAVLLTVVTPLCREKPLPYGYGIFPIAALLGVLAAGFGAAGYLMSIVAVVVYVLRSLVDDKRWFDSIFGNVVVVCVPLMAHAIYGLLWGQATIVSAEIYTLNVFEILWLVLLLLVFVVQFMSTRANFLEDLLVRQSWLMVPVIFVAVGVADLYLGQHRITPEHYQFLALVPVWFLATSWYQGSKWRSLAYDHPWVLALGLGVVFVSFSTLYADSLTQRHDDPSQHTLLIAKDMQESYVAKGDSIAVLEHGVHDIEGYYSAMLKHGLKGHQAPVLNVDELFRKSVNDMGLFHMALMNNNFQYLWLHTPVEEDRAWVGRYLKVDRSYLFEVTSKGLRLIQVYPHPSYTYYSLSKPAD